MVIRTNADYFRLKSDILNTLDNVPVSEQVTLDIFESVESDEFDRETGIIGFKKYMTSNYYTCRKQYLCRLTLFNLFLLVGLALIFVDTLLCPDLPLWLSTCLETVAGVFIWQMVGYMAFEWRGDIKRLRRLLQMIDLKFDFRKWE